MRLLGTQRDRHPHRHRRRRQDPARPRRRRRARRGAPGAEAVCRRPGSRGPAAAGLRGRRVDARRCAPPERSRPATSRTRSPSRDLLLCSTTASTCSTPAATSSSRCVARAPGVRVLATSRTTLHVPGEYVVRLQPLPVPRDPVRPRRPAPAAGRPRVRRPRPAQAAPTTSWPPHDADDLVEVLRRLDGLPLGHRARRPPGGGDAAERRARPARPGPRPRHRPAAATRTASARCGRPSTRRTGCSTTTSSACCGRWHRSRAASTSATVEVLAAAVGAPGDPVDLLHRLVDASLVVRRRRPAPATACWSACGPSSSTRSGERGGGRRCTTRFLDRSLAVAVEIGTEHARPRRTRDGPAAARRARQPAGRPRPGRGARDARTSASGSRSPSTNRPCGATCASSGPGRWSCGRRAASPTHPHRAAILGCAAEAARLRGRPRPRPAARRRGDRPGRPRPATRRRSTGPGGHSARSRTSAATSPTAAEQWLRSERGRAVVSGAYVASAALATAYGGDPAAARGLLDRAHAADRPLRLRLARRLRGVRRGRAPWRPTRRRGRGAVLPRGDRGAAPGRGALHRGGRERVARLGPHPDRGRLGRGRAGSPTSSTTGAGPARPPSCGPPPATPPGCCRRRARQQTAALLLICADDAPGAAAVGPQIARVQRTRVHAGHGPGGRDRAGPAAGGGRRGSGRPAVLRPRRGRAPGARRRSAA